jgi:hypothetical protein
MRPISVRAAVRVGGKAHHLLPWVGVLLAAAFLLPAPQARAIGVTLITHGLKGNIDGWVTGMGNALARYSARTANATILKFQFHSNGSGWDLYSTNYNQGNPLSAPGGEIIVLFDWRQLADGNSYNTYQVAAALVPALTSTNFVPECGGHALAEFPLHLVGHSRGGSLVCELARQLGTNGVWIDHITTLDAHPLNNDGFSDRPLYTAVDAPARIYENVVFGDSYYQNTSLFVRGEPAAGACWRRQTTFGGGYTDFISGDHSDIHLWYHGTIDWNTPTSDLEASITSSERATWWTTYESRGTNAGFLYSLIGGGNRFSTASPNGGDSSAIQTGFNQFYDLGLGGAGNSRTALTANNGNWPNPIRLNLTSTNVVSQGDISTLYLYYQWATPATSTGTIALYLDDDLNPFNGNEHLLQQLTAHGTTGSGLAAGAVPVQLTAQNAPVGSHAFFVKLSAGGSVRYLYAPEFIQVLAPAPAPTMDIRYQAPASVVVGVNGRSGQTIVLLQSTDLTTWQPVVTNTLTADRWESTWSAGGLINLFRAVRQ